MSDVARNDHRLEQRFSLKAFSFLISSSVFDDVDFHALFACPCAVMQ